MAPVVDLDDVGVCVVLRVPLVLPDTVRRLVGEMDGDFDKDTTVAALVGVPAGGVAVVVSLAAGVGDDAGVPVVASLDVETAEGVTCAVESGVVVLASLEVGDGELLPDTDPDGVTLTAGVHDGVGSADVLALGVTDAVDERDTLDDGDTPNDRDKLAVAETAGVELAADVAELLVDGDAGREEDATAVREAVDEVDAAGVWVEAAVLEAAELTVGVVELAEARVPENTTPSRFTVPPDAEASGLGANRTHKLAASSAAPPSAVVPGVVEPVERYTVEVPYEAPEGASAETLAYVPLTPVFDMDNIKPCGAAEEPRNSAENVTPL